MTHERPHSPQPRDSDLQDAVVDAICDQYEAAWLSKRNPRIEDYLSNAGEAVGQRLVNELLLAEFDLRKRNGERPDCGDYLRRFPAQADLINRALDQGGADGKSLGYHETKTHGQLDAVGCLRVRCPQCNSSVELVVDTPLAEITCSSCGNCFSLVDDSADEKAPTAGTTIGQFELLDKVGVGGFGSVWKAQDKELDRIVSIKIPRRGQLDAVETEQFLREARAAAQLSHPNIVSIHEVGRDGDTIYIVSDFVHGVSLSDHLAGHRLSLREAAALCAAIGEALHHAHQNGVIHRDLKPSNIIMDARERPHLTDFGLARREAGEVTMTCDGQVLGTPAYMSPELAQGEAHRADRRSDVYSLGVILFELLTGELPFRGNARMLIQQAIHEEPPSPRKLNYTVPRDLETICLKCLDKEPHRRYMTGQHVADDLRRFLDDQPIRARRTTHAERLRRWCRRNPVVASLTAAVATLLLLLAIAGSLMASRQKSLADVARVEAERAQDVVDRMLTRTAEQLEYVPYSRQVQRELLVDALEFYREFLRRDSTDPDARLMTALAWRRVGTIQKQLGYEADADDAFDRAIEILNQLCTEFPTVIKYRVALAESCTVPVEALDHHRTAVNLYERLVKDHPTDHGYLHALAFGYGRLGQSLKGVRHIDEAEEYYRRAFDTWEKLDELSTPTAENLFDRWLYHTDYGQMLMQTCRFQEAEDHHRRAILLHELGFQNSQLKLPLMQGGLAITKGYLGKLLGLRGEFEGAAEALVDAIEIMEEIAADPDQVRFRERLGFYWRDLSNAQLAMRRIADAEESLLRSLENSQGLADRFAESSKYDNELGTVYYRLGTLYHWTNRRQDADDAFVIALQRFEHYVDAFPDLASSSRRLVILLSTCPVQRLRNPGRAVDLAQRASSKAPSFGRFWHLLGVAQYQAGRWEEAIESLTKSMELRDGGDTFDRLFLAMSHWQLCQTGEARRWYGRAMDHIDEGKQLSMDFTPLDLLRFRADADKLMVQEKDSRAGDD